jgi:hypothetical protein
VYTESNREVPSPMIKHELVNWGFGGPKKSWWYKLQLFNTEHHTGPLLYFDLDTVIINNIDWMWQLPTQQFWTIRDFKHLWSPLHTGVNSSIMWWDTQKFAFVWDLFKNNVEQTSKKYRGDQDYITEVISLNQRRFFDINRVKSWRWECLDGGYNFAKKKHLTPGIGTVTTLNTSVLVFHGNPKPDQIVDPFIIHHWQ